MFFGPLQEGDVVSVGLQGSVDWAAEVRLS